MFQVLVESRATQPRSARWTLLSVVAHSALVGLAVLLTAHVAPTVIRPEAIRDVVYQPQLAPEPAATPVPVPIDAITPIVIGRIQFAYPSVPILLETPSPE